jgi:hypothetical protein
MTGLGKWKSRLASSSLPLEFDVAKLLAARQFEVDGEFPYARMHEGVLKQFSVDVNARRFVRSSAANWVTVKLLVECKHRVTNKKRLFLPVVPTALSPTPTTRDALRVIDEFSPFALDRSAATLFSEALAVAFKGAEINMETGEVDNAAIREGAAQLQYALPTLVVQEIQLSHYLPVKYCAPFMFCPVLVTTAELYLARFDTTMASIESASTLEDIAAPAPFLCLRSALGPDFREHCAARSKWSADDVNKAWAASLDEKTMGLGARTKASEILTSLAEGDSPGSQNYFKHIVVCNFATLPCLLDNLTQAVGSVLGTMRPI